MLTNKEEDFIKLWDKIRLIEKQPIRKLMGGLPTAMLFGLPIVLSVMVVYIFSPVWFAKMSKVSPGVFVTMFIAVLLSIFFFAFIKMHFRWENNEQLYHELKYKQNKTSNNK
jgi:predicted neutral ceramidase superfamily lipid hydrolase